MNGPAIGTIVRANYLPFARVLAESLARHHPALRMTVLLIDDPPERVDLAAEPFDLVRLGELGIPDLRRWLFACDAQQVTVATKPHLLRLLLDRHDSALFLDADIEIHGPLDGVLADTQSHAIVLTPHLLAPLDGADRVERELNILLSGVYNGGVLGLSAGAEAQRFLEWWEQRLRTHCRLDVAEAMHFDQRWLDLVPAFFDDVHLHRDLSVNVAHWNLPERSLDCSLLHFSGFRFDHPDEVTSYSSRLTLADLGAGAEHFERYWAALKRAGMEGCRGWRYQHDTFDDGTPISPELRAFYRQLGGAAEFGDPFAVGGPATFHSWLERHRPDLVSVPAVTLPSR